MIEMSRNSSHNQQVKDFKQRRRRRRRRLGFLLLKKEEEPLRSAFIAILNAEL
jgi:hypothetical protein